VRRAIFNSRAGGKRQMDTRFSKILVGLALIAFATAASGQGSSTAQKTPAPAKPAASSSPYDKALLAPATLTAVAPAEFDVKFTTGDGEFVVHVTRAWAPRGADRFYNLVRHHYFDGAAFFRVIPGFMAQFGLSAYPEVNKAFETANIKDDPVKESNTRAKITFATAGPNTRSNQLFINFGNNASLDAQGFAPFGVVTSGMEVVDKIYPGYKEQPDQDQITKHGKEYLEPNFPKLTIILSARLLPAAPAAAKPASQQ
jgi:peptidyl-prolyl cis-trans isomerase A (cyclophilin A)